jgi:hypothetical protein
MKNDIEQGENAPLLGRSRSAQAQLGSAAAEPRELIGMEAESVKEKAVTGVAGIGCTCASVQWKVVIILTHEGSTAETGLTPSCFRYIFAFALKYYRRFYHSFLNRRNRRFWSRQCSAFYYLRTLHFNNANSPKPKRCGKPWNNLKKK